MVSVVWIVIAIVIVIVAFAIISFISSLMDKMATGLTNSMSSMGLLPKKNCTFNTFDDAVDAYVMSTGNHGSSFTVIYRDYLPARWFKAVEKHGMKTARYRDAEKVKNCIYVECSGYNVMKPRSDGKSPLRFNKLDGLHDLTYCDDLITVQELSEMNAIVEGRKCTLLNMTTGIHKDVTGISHLEYEAEQSLLPSHKLYKVTPNRADTFSIPDICKSCMNYMPSLGLLTIKTSPATDSLGSPNTSAMMDYKNCTSLLYEL